MPNVFLCMRQMTKKRKHTLDDMVYLLMRDGKYHTFWSLQQEIQRRSGRFFGEPTISASIRNLRQPDRREKYNLPKYGEIINKKRRSTGKGYEYCLLNRGEENGR